MKKVFKCDNKLLWIELLRVLSMLWIIAFHFTDHGTVDMTQAELSINWIVMAFFRMGGGIGNCIFVLISGYLLCDKKFKISRLLKLYFEVYFYSVLILIICFIFSINRLSVIDVIQSFFPISQNEYWFISSYMFLSFLSPFINIVINKINYTANIILIFILFIFASVIPTFMGVDWTNSGGHIEIFVMLYLIGALIKKYDLFNEKCYKYFLVFLVVMFLMLLSEIIIKRFTAAYFAYFVWTMKKTPVIIVSTLLFVCVKNLSFRIPRFISWFSGNVFGVYLIHIGKISPIFFNYLFDISRIYHLNLFIFYITIFVLCVFIICIFFDKLRVNTIERVYMPLINFFSGKIDNLVFRLVSIFHWLMK